MARTAQHLLRFAAKGTQHFRRTRGEHRRRRTSRYLRGPARAIRCAGSVRERMRSLGLQVRTGCIPASEN
jgi:hypothetical protein